MTIPDAGRPKVAFDPGTKKAWGGGAGSMLGGKTLMAFVARDSGESKEKERFLTSYTKSFANVIRRGCGRPVAPAPAASSPGLMASQYLHGTRAAPKKMPVSKMGQSRSAPFLRRTDEVEESDAPLSVRSFDNDPDTLASLKDMRTRQPGRTMGAPTMSSPLGQIQPRRPRWDTDGQDFTSIRALKDRRRAFMELLANPDLESMISEIFQRHGASAKANLTLEDLCMVLRDLHRKLGLPHPEYDAAESLFKKFDAKNRKELNFVEFFELILALLRQNCFDRSTILGRDFFVQKHEGSVWDRYEKVKQLGVGAFGTAYLVKQKYTKEARVCKAVKKSRVRMPVEDVEKEIMVMRQIDHPHIVRLKRWYEDSNHIYLVMDYCRGGTLRAVVLDATKCRRALKEKWTRTVITHVLKAMAYCHTLRLIHKDLKDENIMLLKGTNDKSILDDEPFAVIIDLGIAEMFSPTDPYAQQSGGTPTTMAPEVWLGTFGPKCDVWSVGCVLYELLTGRMPFVVGSLRPQAWINLHKRGAEFAVIKTSSASKALCQAMLTFDEDERPTMVGCLEHEWFEVGKRDLKAVAPAEFHHMETFCKESALQRGLLLEIASRLPMDDADRVVEVFNSFDKDNDGMISFNELDEAFKQLGVQDVRLAKKVFKVLDMDGDGNLTFTEFCSLVLVLFKDLLAERFDKMLQEFDVDSDGFLDSEETKKFLTQVQRMMDKDPGSRSSGIINDLLAGNRKIKYKEMREKLLGTALLGITAETEEETVPMTPVRVTPMPPVRCPPLPMRTPPKPMREPPSLSLFGPQGLSKTADNRPQGLSLFPRK